MVDEEPIVIPNEIPDAWRKKKGKEGGPWELMGQAANCQKLKRGRQGPGCAQGQGRLSCSGANHREHCLASQVGESNTKRFSVEIEFQGASPGVHVHTQSVPLTPLGTILLLSTTMLQYIGYQLPPTMN